MITAKSLFGDMSVPGSREELLEAQKESDSVLDSFGKEIVRRFDVSSPFTVLLSPRLLFIVQNISN